jgi:hypothetical protein
MFRPVFVAVIAMCSVCAVSARAAAQDPVDPPQLKVRMTVPPSAIDAIELSPATRGPVLPALYVSLIGLQAYDGYSTSRGLRQGAIESNTFMGRLASHPGALWAAKGGAAFLSIYTAERLWRQHHRGEAIGVMVLSNGIMAAVAASNARIIHNQK